MRMGSYPVEILWRAPLTDAAGMNTSSDPSGSGRSTRSSALLDLGRRAHPAPVRAGSVLTDQSSAALHDAAVALEEDDGDGDAAGGERGGLTRAGESAEADGELSAAAPAPRPSGR